MKRIYIISALLFSLICVSCANKFDVDPYGYLDEEFVFENKDAIDAMFITTYTTLPIEDFNFADGYFSTYPGTNSNSLGGWAAEYKGVTYSSTVASRSWSNVYKNIRYSNILIEQLPHSAVLNETERMELLGEAHFLRAYAYYYMVRNWGGVPIIKVPIDYSDDTSSMKYARSQEEDVWDFILEDLNFAIDNMSSDKLYGRVNKYVALGLKSRVALYAASIAKFGTLTANTSRCVGINPLRADYFYRESMSAAERVITEGGYTLFDKYSDRSENFQMLFLETQSNDEVLWAKGFDYDSSQRTHSWDAITLPHQLRVQAGESCAPYLETVEAFETLSGELNKLIVPSSKNDFITTASINTLFADRDPRLAASIVLPNTEHLGEYISIQDGVMIDGEPIIGNDYGLYFDKVTEQFVDYANENTILGTGASGGTNIQTTGSGFFMKKYVDINLPEERRIPWKSESDWVVMRLAEIYLNYAEAAVETGENLPNALDYLNKVRERAGMPQITSDRLSSEQVTSDRRAELLFEGFKYWDMVRRRTLLDEFDRFAAEYSLSTRHGLEIYYDYENNLYQVSREQLACPSYTDVRAYYHSIPETELAKHSWPNNPGY